MRLPLQLADQRVLHAQRLREVLHEEAEKGITYRCGCAFGNVAQRLFHLFAAGFRVLQLFNLLLQAVQLTEKLFFCFGLNPHVSLPTGPRNPAILRWKSSIDVKWMVCKPSPDARPMWFILSSTKSASPGP